MNQSGANQGQASSQDAKDKKELAAGEFVYEFFQPAFESTFDYQFSSGSSNAGASPAESAALVTYSAPAPVAVTAPLVIPAQVIGEPSSISQVGVSCEAAPIVETLKAAPAYGKELQAKDDCGAIIFYGRWNIMPHRIKYADKSIAEFEYDEAEQLIGVKDRDGTEWVRITQPDHRNIATWKAADGQTCDMSMAVIPDGTYQCTSAAGVIQTCTLTGRIVVWTPFTDGFDLKRTLFAIFRRVDANQDSGLSKEELELAARQIWQDSDAIQLIKMLQAHYDAICSGRKHALCRQGSGITIEDILGFDAATLAEQESRCTAPPHLVAQVKFLFDEMNVSAEKVVTIHQVRIAYDKRHERESVSRTILKTIYEELLRSCASSNNVFSSRENNLTRSDLVQAYKAGYKQEMRGRIKIAGWGTDECAHTGQSETRTLYVDPNNPLESILPQAVRHSRPNPDTAIFRTILEALATQCPHLIVRMISQANDGTFKVDLPGLPQGSIAVAAPTPSALEIYQQGCKFGFWMYLLEEAYKQYEAAYSGKADLDHLDAIERIYRLLLGQSGKWTNVKELQLSDLGLTMRDTFKQRRVMIAVGIQNSSRAAAQRFISRSAVCGILNFDFKNGRVTISDPLKDNGNATSDPLSHSQDGSVLVSLSNFSAAFDKIYVEDWQPTDDMFQK